MEEWMQGRMPNAERDSLRLANVSFPESFVGPSQFSLFSSFDAHTEDTLRPRPPPGLERLPDSILRLFASSSSSPWRFTWSLAYCAAADVAPPETFHRLKLTLLLTLVMTNYGDGGDDPSSRRFLDVLVCGTESDFIDRILTYFGKNLAPKFVKHSVLSTSIVRETTSTYDLSPTTTWEAGSLHLALLGVCHLGYLPRFKKSDLHLLKHAMESRNSVFDVAAAPSSSSSAPLSWQRQRPDCLLWGYCDPEARKSKKRSAFGAAEDVLLDAASIGVTPKADPVSEVFGLKVFTDSPIHGVEEALHVVLAEFILSGGSSSSSSSSLSSSSHFPPPPPISATDLKQFLAYASSTEVKLTPEAKTLITGYYIFSRKRRNASAALAGDAVTPTAFPASAISTLTSLAIAHAKLRINATANEGDALAAILLFEESVTLHSGFSHFDVFPLNHLLAPEATAFDAESWLGAGNDAVLARLAERVHGIL